MRKFLFYALTIFISAAVLFGCKTRQVVEYRDRYISSFQHDTLINTVHDSIYHNIYQKGDTVYDTKYIDRVVIRERVVIKNDTTYIDVFKDKIIEKKVVPKWAYFCLFFSAIMIIFALFKISKKVYSKWRHWGVT